MIYGFGFLLLVAFAIYGFLLTKKKKAETFPANWHNLLIQHVHFYKDLSAAEQKRFQSRIMLFLSEINIESVGFELEDLDRILIASSAVIPVFNFPEWYYKNLSTVLVYPDHFNEDLGFAQKDKNRNIAGMVGSGQFKNQMLLSRKALHSGFKKKPHVHNTGIHEFVHLIDKQDGVIDGVPERLIQEPYVIPWLKIIHKEIEAINDNESDIRNYGGTNEAEFLAVASEYFFEQPDVMKKNHPDLYQMLKICFRVKN
ncbi:zinc-dependent peptidase [Cellulophaga sp. 20_2_10]|uniref:M90 family metallopeptidase n=1 Tax=Cellulophaga sp. 20_2_10 TaxID=2942476 RepID=UPI00201ABEFA|nr:M90 family metallopeptidase [Cellulophaga sp. 20_2_10]MCL5246815.1 zinc-dependent peptidase [Cellulophaga sp. 20_2_10]